MKLYEPFTFLLMTFLIFAFSGTLFTSFVKDYQADCWKANAQLRDDNREGPLQRCTL